MTELGEEECVLARTATGIEDGPRDLIGNGQQCLLRPADLPGWLAGVKTLEAGGLVDRHGDLRF